MATKIRLYESLVVSVLTYRCESWTLKAESERRIAAFEMIFFRRILKISYRDHITNISVMQAISEAAGPQKPLLATVKRRKLQWFGDATRHNTLAKEILQGTVKGGGKRGRPQQMCMDNTREWTGLEPHELCNAAQDRPRWRKISVEASKRAPLRSVRTRDDE